MALGMFDGVHLGHSALVKTASEIAQQLNMDTAAFTFADRPQEVLSGQKVGLICTLSQRKALLETAGADLVAVEKFADVREFSPQQFVDFLVQKYHVGGLVCGSDFRFAKDGSGNSKTLANLCASMGLAFKEVSFVLDDAGEKISSSSIRKMLKNGLMHSVQKVLGRPFFFEGEVHRGKGLARLWKTPTINQILPEELAEVAHGVYQSRVQIDGKSYAAITNVGSRPTFEDGDFVNAETHILEGSFSEIRWAKVELMRFVRPEQKFENEADLQAQIQKDISFVKELTK